MSEKTGENLSSFKIAATYIGTIVGAGFASGQEVLQFFSAFGLNGILGISLSTLLFFVFGYMILRIGYALQASAYVEVVRFSNGKVIGTIIDLIITIFLFGALAAMIAGAGAIFDEQFHLSPWWGTTLMAVITLITVIRGIDGVINAISIVVPVLLIAVLFIAIYGFYRSPITAEDIQITHSLVGAAPNWVVAALNYASFNLVIAVAILAPMGANVEKTKTLFWGSLMGALGLGIGVVAIYFSILSNITEVGAVEVPMIYIASLLSPFIQLLFAVVLFAAVFSTAVSNLYGFVSRMHFVADQHQIWVIIGTTAAAFLVSQVGFSTLVKYLYPAVGYGGFLFFAGLLYAWFTKKDQLQNKTEANKG
ncbi:YkvI family membrane protein [Halalkalibacter akibai]|uniref:Membrane protein YkvI n=1 Tax=Halalkalibacter akibai (strain ATCC 43226 / DSM 21942 / CIP 109018 / JCM 9157 / 1139) TaxID=1236973 RepID=W4QXZ9_HALA3|nr:hypothetical protein [Halalkalibacter akibai]GAE36995.1 hypothetical protein JCM9157_4236 [Halalkalibacter akibai JCM 9157]